ncbi:MAG: 4'-phosphopantetheinyl transferase superfamily protein [Crocinitomix sp.]|nr:4'-phosphopantetheinyl transferase superfamily protein [Crocinitomix sp.]
MNFEIDDIIENDELSVKVLTYKDCAIDSIDLTRLSAGERERFKGFGAKKRKLEYYFTRVLWRAFTVHQPIKYTKTGKPCIENGFISISHSSKTVAISYSVLHPIGLDIEHFNPKIWRIQDKFLSLIEKNRFDLNNEQSLTTLWSIKEAVYKLLDIEGLSFKRDIEVLEVGVINRVSVQIGATSKAFTFSRIVFDSFILIYCTNTFWKQ